MPKHHFLTLLVFICVACSQLFRPGLYTSPDGELHLVRLAWFTRYLTQGHLYPRWISELNNFQGYPIFTFAYPLPYYLASLPHFLGFDLVSSLKVTLLIATALSVVFFYNWISTMASRSAALSSTILFLITPYRFINLYVRLAFGEIIFLAFIPAVFYALEKKRLTLASFFIAASALSHLQLTSIFIPVIVIYCVFRRLSWLRPLILGLCLSAFFWLPALVLQSSTFFSSIHQFPPADHQPTFRQILYSPWGFGFSHPGPDDGMSFQLGIANWLVLTLGTISIIVVKPAFRFFILLSWLVIVVMAINPLSFWSWPVFSSLQFPWRLLLVTLILIPPVLSIIKPRLLVASLLLLAIYTNRNHIRLNEPQFTNVSDTYFFQTHVTTTATPKEFMPLSYTPQTPAFFSSSSIIIWATALSGITAVTIALWPLLLRLRSRSVLLPATAPTSSPPVYPQSHP